MCAVALHLVTTSGDASLLRVSKGRFVVLLLTYLADLLIVIFNPMKKTFLSFAFALALVVGGVAFSAHSASAQSLPMGCSSTAGYSTSNGASCNGSTFVPVGCSSTAGYSTVTGAACNGNALSANGATSYPMGCTSSYGYGTNGVPCTGAAGVGSNGVTYYIAGCNSYNGYSSTTGMACTSTSSVSTMNGVAMFPGCTSTTGFSSITGQSCAGSMVTTTTTTTTDPGLPDTGEAGRASVSILMLLLSGGLAAYGITRLVSSER